MPTLRPLIAVFAFCCLSLVLFGQRAVAQLAPSGEMLPSVAKLAADLSDSVVNISESSSVACIVNVYKN